MFQNVDSKRLLGGSMKSKLIYAFLILGEAIGCAVPILAYRLYFEGISSSHDKWGQFGDFFGGVTGPLLGFVTFMGVLYTIYINQEEINILKNENQQNSKKNAKEETYRLIETIYLDINSKIQSLEFDRSGARAVMIGSVPMTVEETVQRDTVSYCLSLSEYIYDFKEFDTNHNRNVAAELARLIEALKRYCVIYEEHSGSKEVTWFFKNYYFYLVNFLWKVDHLTEATFQYYQEAVAASATMNVTLSGVVGGKKADSD